MRKLSYSSPEVVDIECMTGAILAESTDTNTIPSLDLYELIEE